MIIDLSKITDEKMTALLSRSDRLEAESGDINISAINNTQYDLQGAISAFNSYMGDRTKSVGLKVTFVTTSGNPDIYVYTGGSFVATASWKKINF